MENGTSILLAEDDPNDVELTLAGQPTVVIPSLTGSHTFTNWAINIHDGDDGTDKMYFEVSTNKDYLFDVTPRIAANPKSQTLTIFFLSRRIFSG